MIEGDGQRRAFWNAYQALKRRIELFLALPIESIDQMTLGNRLRKIGKLESRVE
jgi:hypothetical protein